MGWIIEKLWLFENRGKPQPVWAELSACHAWSPLPWQAAWRIGQSPGLEVRGGLDSGPGSAPVSVPYKMTMNNNNNSSYHLLSPHSGPTSHLSPCCPSLSWTERKDNGLSFTSCCALVS